MLYIHYSSGCFYILIQKKNGIKERDVLQRRRNSLWEHYQHSDATSARDEKNSYLCIWRD